MSEQPQKRALLPTNIKPEHYEIELRPDLDTFTFDGSEKVWIRNSEANTQQISFHSNKLSIEKVTIEIGEDSSKREIHSESIKLNEENQTVEVHLNEPLNQGRSIVKIDFKGTLNDQMVGFYRSSYSVGSEKRWMATTQFEPTDARMAFPCWDEPALKATFSINLLVPSNLTALSNMPVISESPVESSDGKSSKKLVKFDKTPIMSTYLVAFCVGELEFVEDRTKEGVVIRVYTPPGKVETGRFALNVAVKTLSYYTQYFEIPYPLPKLDQVAIPDFSAGAMENWGLVTYRETALLVDEKTGGVATKQRVAYVVAHELAHQWFGNLVTMDWWKELWLNEGFATFVGNQAVDVLFPEWDIWTQFVSQYFATAMRLDGLVNSHPIEVEVWNSSQINEIFDAISYSKGASIIRQVANYLGEEAFKKGLNIYLNRHKYSNAVTEDLWKALGESSGKQVSEFMNRWTKEVGYPVVSIKSTESPNKFQVSQRRFLSSGAEIESNDWWISLSLINSKHSKLSEAILIDFKERDRLIEVDQSFIDGSDWLKVNAQQSGFYRVNYDLNLANRLAKAIENHQLSAVDRLGIQSDAFALARAGLQKTSLALLLAQSFTTETDYTVWSDLAGNLAGVSKILEETELNTKFDSFSRKLFKSLYDRLGWEKQSNESDLDTLLRALVINQLGQYNDEAVIAEAKNRFKKYIAGESDQIAADYRYTVFSLAVKFGSIEEYEGVLNIYRTASMHDERLRALRALGSTKDSNLLTRTLELSLSDEVKSQDLFYVTSSTAANPLGRQLTWDFFRSKWNSFEEKYKDSLMIFSSVIGSVIGHFTTLDKVNEIEQFFNEHPVECAARTVKQTIEVLKTRVAWYERDPKEIHSISNSINE